MAIRNFSSTAADTTLTTPSVAADTTLDVAATTGFPAPPFILALEPDTANQEVVLVTGVAGLTLTVTRGYDSTVAVNHASGVVARHSHAAIDFREANVHVNSAAGVHGVGGDVVGTTGKQVLTNKDFTAVSNTFPASLATDAEVQTVSDDLAAHAAKTAAHGASGAVVGTTGTQTLTNKTLDSPTITGVGHRVAAVKTADESVASSTTLQDDDHLLVALEAGTYVLDGWLLVVSGGGQTGDWSGAFTFSGTATGAVGALGAELDMSGQSATLMRNLSQTALTDPLRAGVNAANGNILLRGTVVVTAPGTLRLRWAQFVSTTDATIVRSGSWIRCERVA